MKESLVGTFLKIFRTERYKNLWIGWIDAVRAMAVRAMSRPGKVTPRYPKWLLAVSLGWAITKVEIFPPTQSYMEAVQASIW
tara:strand:- start:1561 stop:1806 length:246 start_codon:yes stop_codon:yes gene_type:complete